jgi:MutS domain V
MSEHANLKSEILLIYKRHLDLYGTAIQKLKKVKTALGFARLFAAFAAFGGGWWLWPSSGSVFSVIIIFLIVFVYLVFRDSDKTEAIKNYERLIRVNQQELDAMHHHVAAYDQGLQFIDPNHAYASDLDLFGGASLFQWISRCHSDQSKKLLADYLKGERMLSVADHQQAARELSRKQEACQQFQSRAMGSPITHQTEKKINHWMDSPDPGYEKPYWKWVQNIYPVFPLTLLIFYLLDTIPQHVFMNCILGFACIAFLMSRKISPQFKLVSNIQPEMETLGKQLHLIEKENYQAFFLQSLQSRLKSGSYASAAAAIRDFNVILKRIEWRSNLVLSPFLAIFLLWDLRIIVSLNEWRKKNQLRITDWFCVIAEMEVMISIASLIHNEPQWCLPLVDDDYFHFEGKDIGHPLIPDQVRVLNDFSLQGTGQLALITGSNMAGKSTFLRSLGVNTVLAQMGAPVCARYMRVSRSKLVSSMRVADNLSENTSTFYAELKKLQYIIHCINHKEPLFILLDEVLRGTNSTDRHKGSRALVRQLLRSDTVAVMATHDTELAYTEGLDRCVHNYHFEGSIVNDELLFDYTIKNGICESLNATTLMKKIGIHFED